MRFNLLVAAVALRSLVSALPLLLSELAGELNVRSETDLWPELTARNTQWDLSIRKHNPPMAHWGLYLHPAGKNSGGVICEAKSSKEHKAGVTHLEVKCFPDTRDEHDLVTLALMGPLGSEAEKEKAEKLLKSVKCETPQQNCVDYVYKGGKAMHDSKLIDQSTWKKIEHEFNTHEAEIRQETSHHFTKPKPKPKP